MSITTVLHSVLHFSFVKYSILCWYKRYICILFAIFFLNVFASANKVIFSSLNAMRKSTNLQTTLERQRYDFHRRYLQGFLYLTIYVNVNGIDEHL